MSGFSFGNLWIAISSAASFLGTLAQGLETSVHNIEADHPIVAQAVALAEATYPGLAQIEGIAHTVLSGAQTLAHAVAGAANAAPAAK